MNTEKRNVYVYYIRMQVNALSFVSTSNHKEIDVHRGSFVTPYTVPGRQQQVVGSLQMFSGAAAKEVTEYCWWRGPCVPVRKHTALQKVHKLYSTMDLELTRFSLVNQRCHNHYL